MRKILASVTAVAAALLMAGCARQQDTLVIDTGNLSGETITVAYNPAGNPEALQVDTVVMTGHTCTWNRPIEQTTKIGIKLLSEDRTDVKFWMVPGEKARVRIDYASDGARFYLKGSPQLKMQSQMYNEVYRSMLQLLVIESAYRELMAQGVENVDEQYADSLSDAYSVMWKEVSEPWLGFINKYPNDPRSACYLLNLGDMDRFLDNYPVLGESVREGEFKEILDSKKTNFSRRKVLEETAARLAPGTEAPVFEAVDLNGKTIKLSDYADKYIVLDFWGTWCPWCVKGMPKMKEYYAKCNKKVEFIGVDCRDKLEKVQAFLAKENISWTNVQSGENGNPDIVLMYGVTGYPTKILIGPGLEIKNRYLGEVPEFYQDLDNL